MKRIPILFAFALISCLAWSQVKLSKNFTYSLGKPYEVIDSDEKYYLHNGKFMIKVALDKDGWLVQKFDIQTMVLLKKTEINDFPDGYGWESIALSNNNLLIFYNSYDKKTNTEQLYYRAVDIDKMAVSGKDVLLYSVKGKVEGTLVGKSWVFKTRDKFNMKYSSDSSRILVYCKKNIENDKTSPEILGVAVFDREFKQIWEKEIKMPYVSIRMQNLSYSIDYEGNIYIMAVVSNNNLDMYKCFGSKGSCHMEVLKILAGSGKVVNTSINFDKLSIYKVSLFESPKKTMVCTGFYSKTGRMSDNSVDGIFMFTIRKEGSASDITTYEIPVDVLNQYSSQRAKNKNEKRDENDKAEFEHLLMKDVKVMDDGSIILIGEQQFSGLSSNKPSESTTDYFNDMLITKIGPDGKLAWMNKLPKRQKGKRGQGGLSYKYIMGKKDHYLLFLDNKRNQDQTMNDVPIYHDDHGGGLLAAYKVNNVSGEVEKEYIFDVGNVKGTEVFQFKTSRIVEVTDNDFLIEVYKKKKEDVLIKLTMKNE